MKMLQRVTASTVLALVMGTACFGQHHTRINLVSNTAGAARVTDPQLINPWAYLAVPAVRGGAIAQRYINEKPTSQPDGTQR